MEENIIICPNCANKNSSDSKFCTNCGSKIEPKSVNQQVATNQVQPAQQPNVQNKVAEETPEETKKGNTLAIISILLYLFGPGVGAFIAGILTGLTDNSLALGPISLLTSSTSLAGIVIMIVGRVKYPKNKALKVIMWIMIGMIALSMLAAILLIAFCFITCSSMDLSGCN